MFDFQDKSNYDAVLKDLLSRLFSTDDLTFVQALGASTGEGFFEVPFFKKPCIVKPDGVFLDGAPLQPIPSIVVVRYLLNAGDDPIFNLWVPFRDLKDAAQMGLYVQSKIEQRIADYCSGKKEHLRERLESLGGDMFRTGRNPELAVDLHPFPRIPLLVLFWDADAESSGSLQFLMDKSARGYLDVESLVGLLDYIRFKIEE